MTRRLHCFQGKRNYIICVMMIYEETFQLDEIWDLIESVSEGFLTYSFITLKGTHNLYFELIEVLSISLSCLLHDGFHSCLFLYSCMP